MMMMMMMISLLRSRFEMRQVADIDVEEVGDNVDISIADFLRIGTND